MLWSTYFFHYPSQEQLTTELDSAIFNCNTSSIGTVYGNTDEIINNKIIKHQKSNVNKQKATNVISIALGKKLPPPSRPSENKKKRPLFQEEAGLYFIA